jgi:hypothetical protein
MTLSDLEYLDRNSREYREAKAELLGIPIEPDPTDDSLPVEKVSFNANELQAGLDRMVQAKMKLPLTYGEALLLIVFQEMANEDTSQRSSDG